MIQLLPRTGPQRKLACATFINTIGNGVYSTAGILYFTRALHLPAAQVGLGLSTAGACALAAGVLVGHVADRRGPRGVYAGIMLCGAVTMAGFAVVRTFLPFLLIACLGAAAQAGSPAARGPIIREYGGERPQELRAYLRSVSNLGISAGAVLAGLAVQADTFTAYQLLIVGNGISFLICAAIVWQLPPLMPVPPPAGPRWVALHDRPYVALTLVDSFFAVQIYVMTVAIPLWVVKDTSAPRWIISALVVINTIIVVIFQVRASTKVNSPQAGGTALRRAGFALLTSMVIISFAAHVPAAVAVVLLVTAMIVQSVGELWYAAGGFELSFGLAPSYAQGQYLGVFGIGVGLAGSVGPAMLTALCIAWGKPGWYVIGALFASAGLAAPPLVRWAEHTRPVGVTVTG